MPVFLQLGKVWINLSAVLWVEEGNDEQGGTRIVIAAGGSQVTRNVSPGHVSVLKAALGRLTTPGAPGLSED